MDKPLINRIGWRMGRVSGQVLILQVRGASEQISKAQLIGSLSSRSNYWLPFAPSSLAFSKPCPLGGALR